MILDSSLFFGPPCICVAEYASFWK